PVETLLAEAKPLLLLRWWQFTPPEVQSLAAQAPEVADVPTDTGRHLLLQGVGVGFYPALVIQADLDAGTLVQRPLEGHPALARRTALVRLACRELSAPAASFVEVLWARANAASMLEGVGG
ncbi:LysR substrate-binding domain-containing protein, partial [Deinococcus sp.]|uniref:LysR substrate-binding domain-containing protein n=1 Tax=Deinococcus sp. TaxID=47478 RepID=UPI00286981E2